jgi:actin-related protein
MSNDELKSVCIDFGSHEIKAGFNGNDAPTAVIPNVIGSSLAERGMWVAHLKDTYIGRDAQEKRSVLALRHPIRRGQVTDWDDLERVFDHLLYSELRCSDPDAMLLTEPVFNSRIQREKMIQMCFETFHTNYCYIYPSALLGLYATGRTTGTVLEIGDGLTQVVSAAEGFLIQGGCARLNNLAGTDLDEYLLRLMALHSDIHLDNTTINRELSRDIKQKMCYLATSSENFAALNKESTERTVSKEYEMVDGKKIKITNEMWQCPEVLFNPRKYLEKDIPGVHQLVVDCIQSCAYDTRKHLYGNIVLSGGTTLTTNFVERFQNEVQKLVPHNSTIKVHGAVDRKFNTWLGASILGSLEDKKLYLTKQVYEEKGASAIHKIACQMLQYE